MYSEVFVCEKTYRTGRARDLGAGIRTFVFQKPYVWGFPDRMLILRIELSALLAPYRAKLGTATGFPAPTSGW
jgi:hypothetical protein